MVSFQMEGRFLSSVYNKMYMYTSLSNTLVDYCRYQDYVMSSVPDHVVKVPPGVEPEVAAITACSGITGYSTALQIRESVETAIKLHSEYTLVIYYIFRSSCFCCSFEQDGI